MPNYCRNLIRVTSGDFQAVTEFVKSEERTFDFNRLIPMPPTMLALKAKCNGISKQSELGFKYWSAPTKADKYAIIAEIKAKYDLRSTLEEGLDRYLAYKDCGHWNSLEWAVANWGTKWNAFDVIVNPSTIFFNTAWSAPIPIYKALARQFPTHKISVKYYDEGGWFAGYCNIEDGDETGEDYKCNSDNGQRIIHEIKEFEKEMETNATINKKACELAADATGCIGTGVAPYVKIRQACIDAIRWQSEQDKLELDAKDQSILQLEMSQFERIASVCRYRCGKIGDTFKCANGKAFGESCTSKNCPMMTVLSSTQSRNHQPPFIVLSIGGKWEKCYSAQVNLFSTQEDAEQYAKEVTCRSHAYWQLGKVIKGDTEYEFHGIENGCDEFTASITEVTND